MPKFAYVGRAGQSPAGARGQFAAELVQVLGGRRRPPEDSFRIGLRRLGEWALFEEQASCHQHSRTAARPLAGLGYARRDTEGPRKLNAQRDVGRRITAGITPQRLREDAPQLGKRRRGAQPRPGCAERTQMKRWLDCGTGQRAGMSADIRDLEPARQQP